jgi:hypothetical protein
LIRLIALGPKRAPRRLFVVQIFYAFGADPERSFFCWIHLSANDPSRSETAGREKAVPAKCGTAFSKIA